MSTTTPGRKETYTPPEDHRYSATAVGFTVFAGVLMLMGGTLHAIQGLVALFNDQFMVVGKEYIFKFDITTWGWIHLILGIVIVIAGCALFTGAFWARVVGVLLAGLGALANFAWLPHYPLWSIVLIAIDVFIIWALCTGGDHRARV